VAQDAQRGGDPRRRRDDASQRSSGSPSVHRERCLLLCESVHEAAGGIGLDEPWGDRVHADPSRSHLVREPFAVGRQGRLRSSVGERRLEERKPALDGGDVDDSAAPSLEHAGEEGSIEPDGSEQVDVERTLPLAIRENGETTSGRRRTADVAHDEVDAAKPVIDARDDALDARKGADVGFDEEGGRCLR
jgi:hypothetical protein